MNDGLFDIVQLASFYVGILNLYENRQQSEHNDVQLANDKQAAYLLEELGRKFDEQNTMLKQILEAVNK